MLGPGRSTTSSEPGSSPPRGAEPIDANKDKAARAPPWSSADKATEDRISQDMEGLIVSSMNIDYYSNCE